MQTNVFLGSADPLLGGNNNLSHSDYDAKIAELQAVQQRLEAQKQQANYLQNVNSSPIWDEIEKLTSELSDREFQIINANEDFQQSQANIANILQREYMRIMRPIVENSADGKKALENHLDLLKSLRKQASREVDKSIELFNEYTQNFSDISYSEFLKLKKSNKKKS